jgi:hypothetical protein
MVAQNRIYPPQCGARNTIFIPVRYVQRAVIDSQKSGTLGAAFVLLQGLVTALFPQISIKFIKQMVGKNFDNASELEAKPAYRRRLRALGVGIVAAAGTSLLLQGLEETDDEPAPTDAPAEETGPEADETAEPDE